MGLIPHDLRRTFARDARSADISQLDVMAIGGMGNSSRVPTLLDRERK